MADIFEQIATAGRTAAGNASAAGDRIRQWIGAPEQRMLRESVVGGLAGAAAGGAVGHFAGKGAVDDDDYKPPVSHALLGAILGGTAGAALPVGARALTGGFKFDRERKGPGIIAGAKNLPGQGLDFLSERVIKNPFVTAYTALHGLGGSKLIHSKAPKSVYASAGDLLRASGRSQALAAAAAKKSTADAMKAAIPAATWRAAAIGDPAALKAVAAATEAAKAAAKATATAAPGLRGGLRRVGQTFSDAPGSSKTRAIGAALGLALAAGFDRKLRGDQ